MCVSRVEGARSTAYQHGKHHGDSKFAVLRQRCVDGVDRIQNETRMEGRGGQDNKTKWEETTRSSPSFERTGLLSCWTLSRSISSRRAMRSSFSKKSRLKVARKGVNLKCRHRGTLGGEGGVDESKIYFAVASSGEEGEQPFVRWRVAIISSEESLRPKCSSSFLPVPGPKVVSRRGKGRGQRRQHCPHLSMSLTFL